jgi:hypothetical protein
MFPNSRTFTSFAAATGLLVCCEPCAAGEVPANTFMDTKLASKPGMTYERFEEHEYERCGIRGGGREGPTERCWLVKEDVLVPYLDQARVVITNVVTVRNLVFSQAKMVMLPEKALLLTQDYSNCADAALSTTISLTLSGTQGYSITKSDSVSTTLGGSTSYSFTSQAGTFGTTLSVSQTMGTSTSTSESFSETVSRSLSSTVSIGPRKQGKIELLAYETTIEVPYSATIVVDGNLVPNKNGLSRASQLLNESERTLPFTGTLRITNVSQAKISTHDVPGNPECRESGVVQKDRWQTSFPAAALPADRLKTFQVLSPGLPTPFKLKLVDEEKRIFGFALDDGPSIGPADGVSYQILYTTETVHPTPQCGFNDLSIPNNGVFTVEAREYTEYSRGNIVARWQTRVENFKICMPV